MGSIVIDSLDHRKGICVVLLCIHRLRRLVERCVANAHAILNEPSVNCLGGVCHEDPSLEVGLGQDIWQRGGMVQVKTGSWSVPCLTDLAKWLVGMVSCLSTTRGRGGRRITTLRAQYKCGKGWQIVVDCIDLWIH